MGEPTNNDLDETIPYQIPPGTPSINKADNTEDPTRVDLPILDEDLGLDRLFEQPRRRGLVDQNVVPDTLMTTYLSANVS